MYILIVGEDGEQREKFTSLCRQHDVETKEESEANIAVQLVLESEPSVVILINPVPDLDGIEILPLMRRLTLARIISVEPEDETSVVKALIQGADVCVSRGITEEEFTARMRNLLQKDDGGKDYVEDRR